MAMTTAPLHDRAHAGVMGEPDPAEPPRRRVRVAPSGDAAAGELVWEPGSVGAAGVFTVPLNPDGTITLETAGSTDVRVAVTGYWKIPTGNDTGLGLDLLEAPTRLVDTTTGTGICDASPCDTLESNTPVEVAVTGQGGLGGEIMAVMVSVTAIDPTGTGVLGVGTTEADLGGGIVVFDPAQHASTTMIIPLTDTGTFTIGSWTQTDVAVDVIGVFKAPTRTWRYEYDTTGMRTAKQLDNTSGTGAEWRKEHTWTASGGLPLLLAEHQGAQSAYVIYGPGGTPIYQINTTGDVQYLHQDHQGSTRLTTNPNGTTRNTITYNAHGEITANTNWWLEQPLNGYTGQYHDPETGYIYLRARHYDPTTGQFTTQDPLVAITEEPYGYVGGNPANRVDPTGLWDIPGTDWCIDTGDDCNSVAEQYPEVTQSAVDFASGVLDVNPITATTNALGISDTNQYANECSGWYRGGQASMIAADLAMGVGFARGSTRLGDAAYRSRFFGADGYLFGNPSLGTHTRIGGGLLNPITRGSWRLGWGVHGVPVFRMKIVGWYIDLLVTSGF